ncbi:phosphotransferase [Actinopolymorpha pittospori]|uniref:Aminoglycoside phosphotransferase domain-containing protein n=1 Tax=Actinopolymorpha pittospori TaxID=648752 RepID=A0A927RNB4_9ACTN|nr:phosphotransferase [Actinopolymorpha pittospori]MBE1610966.1 hypothetical protein [Actinopolymorpha pittospori]
MTTKRTVAERDHLADIARAAFGPQRRVADVKRVEGGTKKGVYRLTFDDASTAIVYSWDPAENYWPSGPADKLDDHTDPFSHASGFDLFEAAHARLSALGIRTPHIYLADQSKDTFPAEVAVVEDVAGGTLAMLLDEDPRAATMVLAQLSDALEKMHLHEASRFGKVALIDSGGTSRGSSCEQIVLEAALADLADAAPRDPRVAHARDRLANALHELAAAVQPRSHYRLIHGELGPEHVLVDHQGHPVIIDIEGLMYFDVEWEHVFLRHRYNDQYPLLGRNDLDERRLRLYQFAMHISLVAKPLSILDSDFPHREGMIGIAESNLERALSLVN